MRLTKWLPKPLQKFVRDRMTVYVYTYGFRPSPSVVDQVLRFRVGDRYLTVTADHRTALYDMISEVVAYDCYQLGRVRWSDHGERRIVDIGANVGVTALVLSQIPGAQVTCYEPDPGNCEWLHKNLAANDIDNVRVRQAAVADADGEVGFQLDQESTGGRVVRDGGVRVPAVTLAKACMGTVDLLKCDCEGGEYDIVDQMTQEVAARIRNISIEVHDLDESRNVRRIAERLTGLGYRISEKPDMWERGALHMLLATRASDT